MGKLYSRRKGAGASALVQRSFIALLFATAVAAGQPLSGDYYIPQGSHPQGFDSLAAAFAAINTNGVSGTVRLLIDGDLNETGANLNLNRTDLSSANNVVIKPAPGKTPTISITGCTGSSGATQYAGLTINGTSYVTIDGSNTDGGTTRDLTFIMNDGTNGFYAINLYANTDYISIKNISIKWGALSSSPSTTGIYANGQSSGSADSLIIDNCTIGENDSTKASYYAVRITGYSGDYASKVYIRNNTLYGKMRKLYFYYVGKSGTTSEISGNFLAGAGNITGYVIWGILLNYYNGTINVFNNQLYTLKSAAAGSQGLYLFGTLNGQSATVLNIYNNFFGGDFQHVGSGTPASIDVISFQDDVPNARVYYNTLYLNNLSKTASGRMTCIRLGGSANVELKDNIIANYKDAAVAYGISRYGGTLVSDYNDIYIPTASGNVGYWSVARKTLSDWQTASGQDAHSVSGNPQFISTAPPIDLHINGSAVPASAALGIGTPIAWIINDFDGQPRDAVHPDAGADEYYIAPPAPILAYPENGATWVSRSPTLRWYALPGTDSYSLQVSADPYFSSPVVNVSGIVDTFYTVPIVLAKYTLYYWRVNATNPGGTSPWSSIWNFRTEGLYVWPGDANNDGKVDRADFYVVVRYRYLTGPARDGATYKWVPQPAIPWSIEAATYADCNGDGRIDNRDLAIVRLNFRKTHSSSAATVGADGDDIPNLDELEASVPDEYALHQNYPNPFNPSTTIEYALPEISQVSIKIYNVLGQEVATLFEGEGFPGLYKVQWRPENLSSGLYFCQMVAHSEASGRTFRAVKKLLYVR
ncbi:MAG: dockerin type I domain-containing protein [Bacteroidota bacterium]